MQRINILARAQAEAEMVQANAPLIEAVVFVCRLGLADQDARTPANAIEDAGVVVLDRHAERLVQQTVIKCAASRDAPHGQLNMGNTVRIDHGDKSPSAMRSVHYDRPRWIATTFGISRTRKLSSASQSGLLGMPRPSKVFSPAELNWV